MNRRKALISLVALGIISASGLFYLNNKKMKRLKPKNNTIPADLHVHLSAKSIPREVLGLLRSTNGLVGLARSTAEDKYLSYKEIKHYPGFREIDKDILAILEYNGGSWCRKLRLCFKCPGSNG